MSSAAAPSYPQQEEPPKKKHTVRNVLLAIVVLAILLFAGCLALVGGAVNEIDKSITSSEKAEKAEVGGSENPLKIKQGQAFAVRGLNYKPGWSLRNEFGSMEVKALRVTNNRKKTDEALVEIKVWQGSEIKALADCTTEQIAVGTTTKLLCTSTDKLPKKFTRITINDTF